MRRYFAGPKLWLLLLFGSALLHTHRTLVDAATTIKLRRNFTSVSRGLTPQASIGIPRRLPSPWGGKLASFRGRPRTTTEPPTPTDEETLAANITVAKEDDEKRRADEASDTPLSVVWPQRSRPVAKRFRVPIPTTPEPQVLLKLLQPKPTRPAIYSLDGFVPKPSIRRPVSTEPPLNFKKTDLQLLSSVPRRRKVNRYSKEDEDDDLDDLQYVERRRGSRRRKKPVSRYTAFARKGIPGEDFPVFTYIPHTDFDCGPQPGLYADPYTDCQVWHMCPGGNLSPRHSFLCPNGTIFNQKKRICDWWYNVDCRKHTRKIRPND